MTHLNKKLLLVILIITSGCLVEEEETTPAPTPTQYTLTVTAGEGGSVSTDGGTYDEGTTVTITATPSEGYRFSGWEGNDSTSESITITLNSNQTIKALFNLIPIYNFTISVTRATLEVSGVNITSNRTIANSGRYIEGTFQEGTIIEIVATPIENMKFNGWEGIESNQTSFTIEGVSDINISAEFIPIVCPDDDCWVRLYSGRGDTVIFEIDENGYHKVFPRWYSANFGEFNILIESSPTNAFCQYAGVPAVSSNFDSNAFYEIEGNISFTLPLYNPFQSLYSQGNNPIKVKDTIVSLSYFQGQIVPFVQETTIYHTVKDKMECYGWDEPFSGPTPSVTGNCLLYSKRKVGPIIRDFIGDTIKIYSNTFFDCGSNSISVKDSISVIIME